MAAITATRKRIVGNQPGKLVLFTLTAVANSDTFNPLDVASTTPTVGVLDWAYKQTAGTGEVLVEFSDGLFSFSLTSGTSTGILYVWLAN